MIFLLGGCDLEMAVIKRLLKKYNKKFFDRNLEWGAKLSSYKDIIEKYPDNKIYAIELENDLGIDVNIIDHHNQFKDNPSSLEQVAKLLNHKLSRFEKAVAINDKSYIYGLIKEFNLSDIKRIRYLDRKAQGVKKEEEEAAKKVNLSRIIYFPYKHFSPLNDRIFFEKGWRRYIIYNDNLTMFYGFDIEKLKKEFKDKKCFYGGSDNSFFGIEEQIEEKKMKELLEDKTIISTHNFMLPFVVDGSNKEEFKDKLKNYFEKKEFEIKEVEDYNEFVYFLPHVRDVLFGLEKGNEKFSEYYESKFKNGKFIIKTKNEIFELDLRSITIRLFNNELIGILSFHLDNYEYKNSEDILKINEFGRRIFPQYLDKNSFVEDPKHSILADEIKIVIDNKEIKEDFSKFKSLDFIKKPLNNSLSFAIPNHIKEFIGDKIKIILDDRMFVVSFYLANKFLLNSLKEFDGKEYRYLENDWWYRYVFVDGKSKTCQSKNFCKKILKKSTYERWVEYGTLWGISRYSFVGVGNWDLFITHTKTLYYQMMVLVLLYRAVMVYFSDRVQNIVSKINKSENLDINDIRKKSSRLYKEYLRFLNGVYFKEVSAQEQGIELYKMALEITDIEGMIKDFNRELRELNEYIEVKGEEARNEKLEKLQIIATIFIPPTLIAAIAGMNVGYFDSGNKGLKYVLILLSMILSALVSYKLFNIEKKDQKEESKNNFKKIKNIFKSNFVSTILLLVIFIIIFLVGIRR